MYQNVAILFSDFGPYHIVRIQALNNLLNGEEMTLVAFRFSEKSQTYGWIPLAPEGIKTVTLAKRKPTSLLENLNIAYIFYRELKENHINAVLLPSYFPMPNLLCVLAAKLGGCKAILMNESWHGTERAGIVKKVIKHLIVRLFNAAIVGGTVQKKYANSYGIKEDRIFLGYDVVDNDYYSRLAVEWKSKDILNVPIPELPRRYFLNLGRFVKKKNLTLLIGAYSDLVNIYPDLDIALVLVGEGEEENNLILQANLTGIPVRLGADVSKKSSGFAEIVFYPFQQSDLTPIFFSRCETFILPSLYEEWGLVVNEALASSTPVIVSEMVGCSSDLVLDDINGYIFNPLDRKGLTQILAKFVNDKNLSYELGKAGGETIKTWSPELFAKNALKAIRS